MKPEYDACELNFFISRRKFLKTSVIGGISTFILPFPLRNNKIVHGAGNCNFKLSLESPVKYFDDKSCFVHPRAGIIPGGGVKRLPRVVLTMTTQDLSGSDVFKAAYGMSTNDLGQSWSGPFELTNLSPRHEVIDGVERPVALSDFWPVWHQHTEKVLGIGHTVVYTPDWKVVNPRPRHTGYSVYDASTDTWSLWQKLEMPDSDKFYNCGAGSVQRYDLNNGTILLPVYYRPKGENSVSSTTVLKCSFDGTRLNYLEHGDELRTNVPRGYGEPSLTFFRGRYFMTLRNDEKGYVTRSNDGLHYEEPLVWKFDDGEELGNYNTQQHWVTHSAALFLVYTRKGANNDHVFRHRAPLFIAKVDPERLCVIRNTEQILVPERGARLGNFGVTDVSPNETWVTVSEWMQPKGVERYGSDGSVFVARIQWKNPNKLFNQG